MKAKIRRIKISVGQNRAHAKSIELYLYQTLFPIYSFVDIKYILFIAFRQRGTVKKIAFRNAKSDIF